MPNYRGEITGKDGVVAVPTGPTDPNPAFFEARGLPANCYAYAINALNPNQPSFNPGHSVGKPTSDKKLNAHVEAAAKDGLVYLGPAPIKPAKAAPGDYLAAR